MASEKRLRKVPGSDFGLPAVESAFWASVAGGGAASQVVSLAGRPTSQGRTAADAMMWWRKSGVRGCGKSRVVNWKSAIALFGASTALVIDGGRWSGTWLRRAGR